MVLQSSSGWLYRICAEIAECPSKRKSTPHTAVLRSMERMEIPREMVLNPEEGDLWIYFMRPFLFHHSDLEYYRLLLLSAFRAHAAEIHSTAHIVQGPDHFVLRLRSTRSLKFCHLLSAEIVDIDHHLCRSFEPVAY